MRKIVFSTTFCLVLAVHYIVALPVVTQTPKPAEKDDKQPDSNVDNLEDVIEYNKYLNEVVKVLESDPDFRDKLDKAAEADIRSGKIAQELEYVSHHVRSKLDELKRIELQRLRELATKQFELEHNIDRNHLKIAEHLDHENQHTFEVEDLKKLILKTSQDLSENDRRRREEFKQYELQKEFEKQEKLRQLDEEHRKQYEEELKKQQQKHDKHEKIHHPGSKAQLEEVWEKQDHMEGADFDPKSFFMMHDVDGNGFWDENEVKVLFINELNKMYQQGVPEDDMRERAEEMERMREHVFKEADSNKDNLISYNEFVEQTKRDEFQKDPDWETVDHQPQFTHEEYLEYERRNQEQIQRLIAEGKLPPHPNMPQGYYPGPNGGYQVPQHQQQQPYHPPPNGQHPPPHYQQQQHQQQGHPQQGHPQQVYHQPGYPQQVNLHPNQVYQHHPDPNYQQHQQQYQQPQQQSGQQSNVYQHPPQPQQPVQPPVQHAQPPPQHQQPQYNVPQQAQPQQPQQYQQPNQPAVQSQQQQQPPVNNQIPQQQQQQQQQKPQAQPSVQQQPQPPVQQQQPQYQQPNQVQPNIPNNNNVNNQQQQTQH